MAWNRTVFPDTFTFLQQTARTGVKVFEAAMPYWGKQWLMLANPTYGSFDTSPYGHDFKKPRDEQRKAKWDVLESWSGPTP